MTTTSRRTATFPVARFAAPSGGLPVEVVLVAQIGIGAGSPLIAATAALQRGHTEYVDALDEPSARIGPSDFARGDTTALYSFVVGPQGHPFHRHAGHRAFTAISGSGGALLRFSTAAPEAIAHDPQAFVDALRHVEIPPDCLFTVRFGGGTWHQFMPLDRRAAHPALFALSCHTDELGGDLDPDLRRKVLAGEADIPSLTECLPASVTALLSGIAPDQVPVIRLSLHEERRSMMGRLCAWTRARAGRLRALAAGMRRPAGFSAIAGGRPVLALDAPAPDSLLRMQFAEGFDHEDCFAIDVPAGQLPSRDTSRLLARLLDSFVGNAPEGVARLMRIRNVLVRPLGLRTSPLGCPVSSLLGDAPQQFAGRHPVLAQRVDPDGRRAEVLLGADDKHLQFRSCAAVECLANGDVRFSLSTRVRNRNLFGTVYMRLIDRTHRRYVAPAMLRMALAEVMGFNTAASGVDALGRGIEMPVWR